MSNDDLFAGLDQLVAALAWYSTRTDLDAADAIVEAIEDWLNDHAPGPAPIEHADPLAGALIDLVSAADRQRRPLRDVLTEAISEWIALQAAQHHRSKPFPATALVPARATGNLQGVTLLMPERPRVATTAHSPPGA